MYMWCVFCEGTPPKKIISIGGNAMDFIRDLLGSVQNVTQQAIPEPQELMDIALGSTSIDESIQQFTENTDTVQTITDSLKR